MKQKNDTFTEKNFQYGKTEGIKTFPNSAQKKRQKNMKMIQKLYPVLKNLETLYN